MANFEVRNIPLENIDLDENTRINYDVEDLSELAESIRAYGVIEPVLLRNKENGRLSLVFGGRRYRASQIAGRKTIPAIIKTISDEDVVELQVIENLQRKNISPLEEADALKKILDIKSYTQDQLAGKIGRSQSWVANRLRLTGAPEDLKKLLISREISPKHVMVLLPYSKYPVYCDIMKELKSRLERDGQVSVRDLEETISAEVVSWGNGGDHTMRVDEVTNRYSELKKYLEKDLEKCSACSHTVKMGSRYSGRPGVYCLDYSCWSEMVSWARGKEETDRQKRIEKLSKEGVVNADKLKYGEWKPLQPGHYESPSFDASSCDGCEHQRLSDEGNPVCLNVKCFEKKQREVKKVQKLSVKEEEERCWRAVDDWLLTINLGLRPEILHFLVGTLANCCWAEVVKKGLSKWGHLKSLYDEDMDKFLEDIPEHEYDQVLIRLVAAVRFVQGSGGRGISREVLEEYLPEAAALYQRD